MANGIVRPVYGPDYGRLISDAFQTANQFGQLQQRRQAGQRREEVDELARLGATDPAARRRLAALDPSRARAMNLMDEETRQRFEKERAHTAAYIENLPADQQLEVLRARIDTINKRGGDPQHTMRLVEMLESGDPLSIVQAQQAIKAARIQGERTGILTPDVKLKPKALTPTSLMRNLVAAGLVPGSDEYKKAALAGVMGTQQRIDIGPEGEISFISGRGVSPTASGLHKTTERALEKKLIMADENLMELEQIEREYKPSYLTYLGRAKALINAVKSKAGYRLTAADRDSLKGRRRFTQGVNRFFNEYRRYVTGAAAQLREIEDLKKAMLSEDLSPAEFEAAYVEFKGAVLRSQRLARKILREGVRGNFRGKKSAAAKELDERFMAGEDDSIKERLKDLVEKDGLDLIKDRRKIDNILRAEGYYK